MFSRVGFNCFITTKVGVVWEESPGQGLFPGQAVPGFPGHRGCGKAEKHSILLGSQLYWVPVPSLAPEQLCFSAASSDVCLQLPLKT